MTELHATPLRLLGEDADDLEVMSAALQDAVTKIGDIGFDPRARQLTVAFNRFRWEGPRSERVRCAFQLGSVLGVRTRKLRRGVKEAVVELLAMSFEPGDSPGGVVILSFAGGGDLRATVECVDALLVDVSSPWSTRRTPAHQA